MRTIFKYRLELGRNAILMPGKVEPLCVQIQNGVPTLWSIVDPDGEQREQIFYLLGTGFALPDLPVSYISTIQDGGFVWHAFRGMSLSQYCADPLEFKTHVR